MDYANSTTPLIAKLPPHKQSGWFITQPEDVKWYALCFFGSMAFFSVLTLAFYLYFESTPKSHYYHAMKDIDKKRFVEILNSNVSHTIVVSFAFYNIFFPDCEGSYPF